MVIGFFKYFFPNENQLGFHMRYHLFLHYGWFLQNLGKDFIRTNMHTTVSAPPIPKLSPPMRLVFWVCGGGHMFLSFSAFMNHTKRLGGLGQKNDHYTTVFHPFDFARAVFLQFTKTKYRLQKSTFSLESRNTWENLNHIMHIRFVWLSVSADFQ